MLRVKAHYFFRFLLWTISLLGAGGITTPLNAQVSVAAAKAVETSICEVTAQPRKFKNLRIRVRAEIVGTAIHGFALIDPNCKMGLMLWYSRSAEGNPDMLAFDHAIYREGCLSTAFKEIHATASGKFLWRPHKPKARLVLEVDQVENLDVVRKPGDCDGRSPVSTSP